MEFRKKMSERSISRCKKVAQGGTQGCLILEYQLITVETCEQSVNRKRANSCLQNKYNVITRLRGRGGPCPNLATIVLAACQNWVST